MILAEKYTPQKIVDLPIDASHIELFNLFIRINKIHLLLISENDFLKNTIVNAYLKELDKKEEDILYINKIKDLGVTNIRSETKLFCQSQSKYGKKIIIIEDIHNYPESIQKLFINCIDKWSKNIHIFITSNTIYNIDEILATRLLPIHIPETTREYTSNLVKTICKSEPIYLGEDMQNIVVSLSESNIQKVFHILEKCKLLQKSVEITADIINKCCTLINDDDLTMYFNLVKKKEIYKGYLHLMSIIENGYSVLDILNELYKFVKITDLLEEEEKYKCFKIVSFYITIFITTHEEEIELLLLSQDISSIF